MTNAFYTTKHFIHFIEQYEEAISDYDEAIRIEPDNADFYHNRGYPKR